MDALKTNGVTVPADVIPNNVSNRFVVVPAQIADLVRPNEKMDTFDVSVQIAIIAVG